MEFAFGLLGGLFSTRRPSRWMNASTSAGMLIRPLTFGIGDTEMLQAVQRETLLGGVHLGGR
ncbi:hypothetical protein [Peristeroidobacter soli]|uniref:hypothetical protein n=1 Tax=Peristeroidobacter soli TaxID=2497877 RepID=UPI00101D3870|nr:hypothetical protein [Peristeroidobacter soli]